jgi:hypothetical protein
MRNWLWTGFARRKGRQQQKLFKWWLTTDRLWVLKF